MADFYQLIERAVLRCGTRAQLARTLRYNANSIRQWMLGLALPDRDVEEPLAALAGVTPDEMRRAIKMEAMRRWEAARARPTTGRAPMSAGPSPRLIDRAAAPSPSRRRRRQSLGGLILAFLIGSGSAEAHPYPLSSDAICSLLSDIRRKWFGSWQTCPA